MASKANNPRIEIDRNLYQKLSNMAENRDMSVPKFVQNELEYVTSNEFELSANNIVELNDALYGYYMDFNDFQYAPLIKNGRLDNQSIPMTHRMMSLVVNAILNDSKLSVERKGHIVFKFLWWMTEYMNIQPNHPYKTTPHDRESLHSMTNELSSIIDNIMLNNADETISFKQMSHITNVTTGLSLLSKSLVESQSHFESELNTFYAIVLLPMMMVYENFLPYLTEHDLKVITRNTLALMIGFNLTQSSESLNAYHTLGKLITILKKHPDRDIGETVIEELNLKI